MYFTPYDLPKKHLKPFPPRGEVHPPGSWTTRLIIHVHWRALVVRHHAGYGDATRHCEHRKLPCTEFTSLTLRTSFAPLSCPVSHNEWAMNTSLCLTEDHFIKHNLSKWTKGIFPRQGLRMICSRRAHLVEQRVTVAK